jgi:phosphoglycerol transferase MdoB-like AlkP superfamily enzyme
MKTYLLLLFGVLLGGLVGYMVFIILFNTPLSNIFPSALLPLGLAAMTSFALARMNPKKWKLQAVSVALPIMFLATLMLILLWIEGRGDWGWIICAGAILTVCVVSSWFARGKNE